MNASNYLENKLLDVVFGSNAAYSRPATLYIALFNSSAFTDDILGTEVSAGVYARAAVTNNSSNFPAAESGVKSTVNPIVFLNPADNPDWGEVAKAGIFDALSAGNLLVYADLTVPRTIYAGDGVSFNAFTIDFLNVAGNRVSNYLSTKLADHVFGGPNYTRPATVYLALFTGAITDESDIGSTVNEVGGGSYARLAITNNNVNWPSAVDGEKHNGTELSFATATGSWGSVASWGLYDSSSSGNLLFFGNFDTPRTVESSDVFSIPQNALSITCD